jgi:hypothetical protein
VRLAPKLLDKHGYTGRCAVWPTLLDTATHAAR